MNARFSHPCDRSEVGVQARKIGIEIQSDYERLNILNNG
jgi:hypothetical protein